MQAEFKKTCVISYPKSGRTWLKALIGYYLEAKKSVATSTAPRDNSLSGVAGIFDTERITEEAGLSETSFTHAGSNLSLQVKASDYHFPDEMFREAEGLVVLSREIKDTLVSAYFQATHKLSLFPKSTRLEDFIADENEKINFIKVLGVLIGFSGIVFLFSDNILINKNNFISALLILCGSTFYVIVGLLTLKISNKKNENVTASILIWGTLILFPISFFIEQPWNLSPRLDSTISLLYLGVFSTGIAWLLRFYILKNNGLVFQSQVAYLIPIFGVILGFLILNEAVTPKVIISLIAVIVGIYIVKKGNKVKLY